MGDRRCRIRGSVLDDYGRYRTNNTSSPPVPDDYLKCIQLMGGASLLHPSPPFIDLRATLTHTKPRPKL